MLCGDLVFGFLVQLPFVVAQCVGRLSRKTRKVDDEMASVLFDGGQPNSSHSATGTKKSRGGRAAAKASGLELQDAIRRRLERNLQSTRGSTSPDDGGVSGAKSAAVPTLATGDGNKDESKNSDSSLDRESVDPRKKKATKENESKQNLLDSTYLDDFD